MRKRISHFLNIKVTADSICFIYWLTSYFKLDSRDAKWFKVGDNEFKNPGISLSFRNSVSLLFLFNLHYASFFFSSAGILFTRFLCVP